MSWNSSAASNYLASFRPIAPVEGFDAVKSNDFSTALAAIPLANFTADTQMAAAALSNLGAIEQVKLAQKGAMDRLNAEIAYNTKNNRRYAGAAIAQVLGGLGGFGGLTLPQRKDPRQMQLEQEGYEAQMRQYRQGRNAASTAGAANALKLIG